MTLIECAENFGGTPVLDLSAQIGQLSLPDIGELVGQLLLVRTQEWPPLFSNNGSLVAFRLILELQTRDVSRAWDVVFTDRPMLHVLDGKLLSVVGFVWDLLGNEVGRAVPWKEVLFAVGAAVVVDDRIPYLLCRLASLRELSLREVE